MTEEAESKINSTEMRSYNANTYAYKNIIELTFMVPLKLT